MKTLLKWIINLQTKNLLKQLYNRLLMYYTILLFSYFSINSAETHNTSDASGNETVSALAADIILMINAQFFELLMQMHMPCIGIGCMDVAL